MQLLERDPLLAALEERLSDAATGEGSMVLIAGEAGIGKTSLVRAFCDRHRQDAQVLWGACDALATPRVLGPLYDIARATGGDLAAVLASEATRHELFSTFLDTLVSPLRPIITVVEDIHWADEATRDLLIFLGRRIATTHTTLLATYRDDELSSGHPLRGVFGNLATLNQVHRLAVPRLTPAAVAVLADGHRADPARVHRISGGNPFFATELLAVTTEQVPETVSDAVLARTARLSAAARAALEAAAIVPDHAEAALVAAISGGDPAALEECLQAGLLQLDGAAVRFRHELARQAVEQHIPATRRPLLHSRALTHLTTRAMIDPARLAYHAEAAGDSEAVLVHAPVAAARASRLGAHREAADHLAHALRYATTLAPAEQAELLEAYAEECTALDRTGDALDAAGRAVTAWHTLGEVERAATITARRSYLLWSRGDSAAARAEAQQAVELLEQRPAGAALATAYTYTAHLHMLAREIPEAIELGSRAVALAEQHGEATLLARALNIVGAAQWFVDPDQAEQTLARALAVARASGDDGVVGIVLRMLGSAAGEVRRYPTADRWLGEAIRWCATHDLDIHGRYCLAWAARSAFEQGRWAEAAEAAGEVAALPAEHAPTRIVALTVLGRLRARRGDPDPHTPLAEAWQLAEQTGDLQRLWPAAAGRAETAWLTGHPEQIPTLVGDTLQLAIRLRQPWPTGELAYWLWKADALDAAPEGAAEPYTLQIQGHWPHAATAWDHIGCPYEAAAARAESDNPAALRLAYETFGRLGATPMADRISAHLRHHGIRDLPRRPTKTTLANPGGLTDRELAVLALLATGATNKDIAATLHISPKTAGHHVSHILTKLGVPTRQQAADAAARLGITARK